MGNPFTLSFGKKPVQYISRLEQTNQILAAFQEENPTNQLFMITGVRGSSKTVMLTNIASEMRKSPNWNLYTARSGLNCQKQIEMF